MQDNVLRCGGAAAGVALLCMVVWWMMPALAASPVPVCTYQLMTEVRKSGLAAVQQCVLALCVCFC